jgi:NAD(P)-dependent dehydrogenase (short-subunit alcohol dehydrogenase family)
VEELRFDGQVAIVTGAGGNPGLGRAYAMLLAERGARVVVNDVGGGPDGRGVLPAHADRVVAEIRAAGGEALADTNSVAEPNTAEAVVRTALETWGRVDILVNNAGIHLQALFEDLAPADLQKIIGVHLMGNVWMSKAVWPHMRRAGYGRIICVASGTMLGMRYTVTYGAAKAGIVGLARGLAAEGIEHGIKVNALFPTALTGAVSYFLDADAGFVAANRSTSPDQVAPVAAVLAHESCPVTGHLIRAGGGEVKEWILSENAGYSNSDLTPEEVLEHWGQVTQRSGVVELPDPPTIVGQANRDLTPRTAYTPG